MLRRLLIAVPLLLLAVAGPAAASWLSAGSGQGAAAAASLQAPGAGSTSSPTSGTLTVTWSGPPGGPAPSGYLVLRDGAPITSGGCAQTTTSTSTAVSCTDSGLASATTYSYTVSTVLGSSWQGPVTGAFSGTTADFAVIGATPVGGSKKYRFNGVGSSGTTKITVDVCRTTLTVCTPSDKTNWVETVTFTPAGPGTRTTGPSTTKLELTPGPYTAAANQGPNSSTLTFMV